MVEQLDVESFTGAHPTAAELVARLGAWGFRERPAKGRRGHAVHQVFRGPHGGTVRVLRSRLGRADPDVAVKAARLLRVDVRQFWAGPEASADAPAATQPDVRSDGRDETVTEVAVQAGQGGEVNGRRRSSAGPSRDQITSLVLAAHTSTDRPLGFDQVVQLCHGRITRDQVRTASAALCRDGHLDRIRSAVYQWSGGQRATVVPPPTPTGSAAPASSRRPGSDVRAPCGPRAGRPAAGDATPSAAELFELLFPGGVQMTGELLSDFEQWAELTAKLTGRCQQPIP